MAPTIEYATLIILDIGSNVSMDNEKDENTFFNNAKQCAKRIIERNIMIKSSNLVGLILLGAKTKNALADQCKGSFRKINLAYELQTPNWKMIRDLPDSASTGQGDWFESLIVAAQHYKEGVSGFKINSKKIVLITNFAAPAHVNNVFDATVSGFQEENFELFVIGPDLDSEQGKQIDIAKRFLEATNGDYASFEEAMQGWLFYKQKAAKLVPQYYELSIGAQIKIPVSVFIRVRDEPVVKNWQVTIKDPVTLTASTTEGVMKERNFINTENQEVVDKEDLIEGYQYGHQIIPFSESDKTMLYQSGDRCLSLYGFTKSSNIQWQHISGDGTYYLMGRKGNLNAQHAINCLVHCLQEEDLVGIVRKVHSKRSEPKMYALMPVIDPNHGIYLSLVGLCYKDEIKYMALPPTNLKQFACTTEQVDAFKSLITAMDLSKAYDDSYNDAEAFPIAETVSPGIQFMLDSIAFRAMNPGKLLPQPRDEITTLFKMPPLVEKRSREPLDKLRNLFPLKKVETKKSSRRKAIIVDEQTSSVEDVKMNTDIPKVTMITVKDRDHIQHVGTLDPVGDFTSLLSQGRDLTELSVEIAAVVENLVYTNFNGIYSRPLEAMNLFRKTCVESNPECYNTWILKFKKDLFERRKDSFLSAVTDNKLGLILKEENYLSIYSEDKEDSQVYENDTIPNSAELTIRSEVNDFFDDM